MPRNGAAVLAAGISAIVPAQATAASPSSVAAEVSPLSHPWKGSQLFSTLATCTHWKQVYANLGGYEVDGCYFNAYPRGWFFYYRTHH
jgi:hypothetical protein